MSEDKDDVAKPRRDARGRLLSLPPALAANRWTSETAREAGVLAKQAPLSQYQQVLRLCRRVSPEGVRRMMEFAEIGHDKYRDKNGNLKPISSAADVRAAEYAINWLVERGFGPPKPYDPEEDTAGLLGRFDPALLSPAQRALVRRAMELILQASTQPGIVEEVQPKGKKR